VLVDLFPRLVSRHGRAKLNAPQLALEVGEGRGNGCVGRARKGNDG
jgi:hypothetical protein